MFPTLCPPQKKLGEKHSQVPPYREATKDAGFRGSDTGEHGLVQGSP